MELAGNHEENVELFPHQSSLERGHLSHTNIWGKYIFFPTGEEESIWELCKGITDRVGVEKLWVM